MKVSTILVAVAAVALSACATKIAAKYDADPDANFERYETYAWISESPHIAAAGQRVNPLNSQRIMRAIAAELTRKGYRMVDSPAEADFVVSFTTGARDKVDVDAYPVTYRGGWGRSRIYSASTVSTREYVEGTLAIDIFDTESKSPAWHGWGSKSLTRSEIEEPAELIDTAVAAILTNFPPEAD